MSNKVSLFINLYSVSLTRNRISIDEFYGLARKSGYIRHDRIKEILQYLIANEVFILEFNFLLFKNKDFLKNG